MVQLCIFQFPFVEEREARIFFLSFVIPYIYCIPIFISPSSFPYNQMCSVYHSLYSVQTWNTVFSLFRSFVLRLWLVNVEAVCNLEKKERYLLNLSFSVGTKLARIIMQKRTDGQRRLTVVSTPNRLFNWMAEKL